MNEQITIFSNSLAKLLIENLSTYLLSTLANMLAIDYEARAKKYTTLSAQEYADVCSQKLKKVIKTQVVLQDDIGAAITLFAIAISPENYDADIVSVTKEESIQTEVLNSIIKAYFPDIKDKNAVIEIFKTFVNKGDFISKINFLIERHDTISSLCIPLNTDIINKLTKMYASSLRSNTVREGIRNTIILAGATLCAVLAAEGSVQILGEVAPIGLIPATMIGVSIGSTLGQSIANKIIPQKSSTTQITKSNIPIAKKIIESRQKTQEIDPQLQKIANKISQHIDTTTDTNSTKFLKNESRKLFQHSI